MNIEEVGMTKNEKYEFARMFRVTFDHEEESDWVRQNLVEGLEGMQEALARRERDAEPYGIFVHEKEDDITIMKEVIRAYRIVISEYSIPGQHESVQDILADK